MERNKIHVPEIETAPANYRSQILSVGFEAVTLGRTIHQRFPESRQVSGELSVATARRWRMPAHRPRTIVQRQVPTPQGMVMCWPQ